MAGKVHGLLPLAPGAVLRPAEAALSIVPGEAALGVTARIAPTDIDALHPGQPVRLRFSGLSARSTPEIPARLETVSAETFSDEMTGQVYYRAEIAPDPGALDGLPRGVVPVPGMPVEVYIGTGARTPLSYLLKPLTDYMTRSFRDG